MEDRRDLDALFLYATEGILVTDSRGRIIRVNPSAAALFGYAAAALTGCPVEQLIPARYMKKHESYRHAYAENPHPRSMGSGMELFGKRSDGSEFPVEISLSPYTSEGETFVIAFILDITLRKQSEERLRNYSADLENQVKNRTLILEEAIAELEKTKLELHHALQKERDLNELKSRFVSMASHEFRTPLTTMMSSLSLVSRYAETQDRENREKHIERIKSSIRMLTDILNDFLSVSKLEEGKTMLTPEHFDLAAYCRELVSGLEGNVGPGQEIRFRYSGSERVWLDQKSIQHIVLNLLSNALKYSPEPTPIDLELVNTGSVLHITVTDCGIGIPEADQKHLFERFFRGQNVAHIQGTGLGLHIVAQYLERLEGTITCNSMQGEGTQFLLVIPLQDADA